MHIEPPHITPDRRGWHFDKGISLATITSIFITFTSLVVWSLSIEKRVSFNEYILAELVKTRKELLEEYRENQAKNEQVIEEMRRYMREHR